MIKATLLLGSLIALGATAVLNTYERNLVEGCESETELWGSVDGTKFYFCLSDNMALEQSCDPGTFFVRNSTTSGCVPLDQVSGTCIYHDPVQPCEGEHLLQPQTHIDPNKYYVCPSLGATPVALTCPENRAFVRQDGYLGCFEWQHWRQIRGCEK